MIYLPSIPRPPPHHCHSPPFATAFPLSATSIHCRSAQRMAVASPTPPSEAAMGPRSKIRRFIFALNVHNGCTWMGAKSGTKTPKGGWKNMLKHVESLYKSWDKLINHLSTPDFDQHHCL